MKHVVVLCGGRSAEHEVSLISAQLVLKQLNQEKYQVSILVIEKDGLFILRKPLPINWG